MTMVNKTSTPPPPPPPPPTQQAAEKYKNVAYVIAKGYFNLVRHIVRSVRDVHAAVNSRTPCNVGGSGLIVASGNGSVSGGGVRHVSPLVLCMFVRDAAWSTTLTRVLLESGAEPGDPEPRTGLNALHYCCAFGNTRVLELCLHAVAFDVTRARDSNGNTCLHYAMRSGSVECLAMLFARHVRARLTIDMFERLDAANRLGLRPSDVQPTEEPAVVVAVVDSADDEHKDKDMCALRFRLEMAELAKSVETLRARKVARDQRVRDHAELVKKQWIDALLLATSGGGGGKKKKKRKGGGTVGVKKGSSQSQSGKRRAAPTQQTATTSKSRSRSATHGDATATATAARQRLHMRSPSSTSSVEAFSHLKSSSIEQQTEDADDNNNNNNDDDDDDDDDEDDHDHGDDVLLEVREEDEFDEMKRDSPTVTRVSQKAWSAATATAKKSAPTATSNTQQATSSSISGLGTLSGMLSPGRSTTARFKATNSYKFFDTELEDVSSSSVAWSRRQRATEAIQKPPPAQPSLKRPSAPPPPHPPPPKPTTTTQQPKQPAPSKPPPTAAVSSNVVARPASAKKPAQPPPPPDLKALTLASMLVHRRDQFNYAIDYNRSFVGKECMIESALLQLDSSPPPLAAAPARNSRKNADEQSSASSVCWRDGLPELFTRMQLGISASYRRPVPTPTTASPAAHKAHGRKSSPDKSSTGASPKILSRSNSATLLHSDKYHERKSTERRKEVKLAVYRLRKAYPNRKPLVIRTATTTTSNQSNQSQSVSVTATPSNANSRVSSAMRIRSASLQRGRAGSIRSGLAGNGNGNGGTATPSTINYDNEDAATVMTMLMMDNDNESETVPASVYGNAGHAATETEASSLLPPRHPPRFV